MSLNVMERAASGTDSVPGHEDALVDLIRAGSEVCGATDVFDACRGEPRSDAGGQSRLLRPTLRWPHGVGLWRRLSTGGDT